MDVPFRAGDNGEELIPTGYDVDKEEDVKRAFLLNWGDSIFFSDDLTFKDIAPAVD